MNNNDKRDFLSIMNAMAENFNAKLTKEGLRVRFVALSEFTIDQVREACMELIKTRVYPGMPTTGEIRAAMALNVPQKEDVAQERINEIMGQIRQVGSYGSPKWKDPIVADLLQRRWSWSQLCAMTEEELKWWAKEFVEVYISLAGSEQYKQIDNGNTPEKVKQLINSVGLRVVK